MQEQEEPKASAHPTAQRQLGPANWQTPMGRVVSIALIVMVLGNFAFIYLTTFGEDSHTKRWKRDDARNEINEMASVVREYYLQHKSLPPEGRQFFDTLAMHAGQRVTHEDPWGKMYVATHTEDGGVELRSAGEDGILKNEDDFTWESGPLD